MQWLLVGLAFALSLGYIGRRMWKSFSGSCAGCGPKKAPALIPASDLLARFKR